MTLLQIYDQAIATGELQHDDAQLAALPELERIRAALANPPKRGWFAKAPKSPKGLYLWGGVGRGKSMLMDMFARSLGDHVRRVHFHAFMQEVHSAMTEARKRGVDDALLPVADALAADLKCLAFDEMQITDITDAMIVGRLFEQLFARGVVIVATSNRVPDDLYKDGLNRALFVPFIDVLKAQMVVHELASPTDYRQDRLAGRVVYFTPLDGAADQGMDDMWLDLAGGAGAPLTLTVKKREVRIPEFRNGVARASFADLCAANLGPADYLALVGGIKVLMLDHIPVLGPSNANEAKRFVTLIDAVYEAQVKFIASAAATPEELYPTGRGSFEFERTASRLREMQAKDWANG
ncbi:MAG: cell division protein ZapE [Planktomarina sp.]